MLSHALLVDDSRSARFALRKLLERSGLRVDIAENAEQALGYLNDNRPDVIFMDHLMPGMDGFEVVKILKAQPNTASIPVVMCTSKDGAAYVAEARAAGAVDILSKPATPGSLGVVLDKLCFVASEEPVIDLSLDIAMNMMPEELFEQVVETSAISRSQLEDDSSSDPRMYEPTLDVIEEKPAMPALDSMVMPVDEIKRIAAASARDVVEREINERVAKQLVEKVPEMREMVMANFDSVVRSMLKGYFDDAMDKAKEDFSDIVRDESRQVADNISREVIESAVKEQVRRVEEALHREMNESLAEVYSNIGELKANQYLDKLSPELEQQLQSNAREVAEEVSRETLIEASGLADDVAREAAGEASQRMQREVLEKLKKIIENTRQAIRTETSEIIWQKLDVLQKIWAGKFFGTKCVAVIALLLAAGAFAAILPL